MRDNFVRHCKGHEIDLFGLFELLWGRRFLVLVIALMVTVLSIVYVSFRAPVYEAKVIVEAPSQEGISQLNYGRGGSSDLEPIKTQDVYGIYVRNLLSESLRQQFFELFYLPQVNETVRNVGVEVLYDDFSKLLRVVRLDNEWSARYAVTVRSSDPGQAALWVARYVEMAGVRARKEVVEGAQSDVLIKMEGLRREIASRREIARKQREDHEVRLAEALAVAKSIGLEWPPIISGGLASELLSGGAGALGYMRGSAALQAEIRSLQARASSDPFIPGLRERQVSLEFYGGLHVLSSALDVYRQDGAVELPDKSVSPSGVLIVIMGLLLGVVLGGVAVLLLHLASVVILSKRGSIPGMKPSNDETTVSGRVL